MTPKELVDWLAERLPPNFYCSPPEIFSEVDEIAILGTLASPEGDRSPEDRRVAELARIAEHRASSRSVRSTISKLLSKELGKPVAWGARCGRSEQFFGSRRTSIIVRLDRTERRLLDLLVKARVANSQSDAIAWALRSLEDDRADWFAELRETVNKLVALQKGQMKKPK